MNKEKYYVVGKGQYWEFNSIKEIFSYKSPAQPISLQNIGHNFNDTYIDDNILDGNKRIKVDYVVYDYLIRVVRKEVLEEELAKPRVSYFISGWGWQNKNQNYPGFRNGPVPNTGRSVYGFYNWHRAIKTTQERRWNCIHKEHTRGKRRNIRTAWDDVTRSDRNIKQSWKKQKKRKQWM